MTQGKSPQLLLESHPSTCYEESGVMTENYRGFGSFTAALIESRTVSRVYTVSEGGIMALRLILRYLVGQWTFYT